VEVFVVFIVSHLVGDYLLQTDWQAANKTGGLKFRGTPRRALCSHVATYTLAYIPALVWLADDIGAGKAIIVAAAIGIPHLVQDDGRWLDHYMRAVKHCEPCDAPDVRAAVDQVFHVVALLLTAIIVGA
jgi:hypothetical protein